MRIRKINRRATVAAAILAALAGQASAESADQWCKLRMSDPDSGRLECGGVTFRFRLPNVDAPETSIQHAQCAEEAKIGWARARLVRAAFDGSHARLVGMGAIDRYGRHVSDVVTLSGHRLRALMLESGMVVEWRYGDEAKPDWCASAAPARAPVPTPRP